ncbi:MAG: hypothetical protein A2Z20_12925 [Bdellovibrionales bacterium RBG_16_40_8]|nr:MAG: hypothetical protein A2Z20_12925 [Bdellovibrionales bacterium RBG_16_40_8]
MDLITDKNVERKERQMPNVFAYTDYRQYLKDFYEFKKGSLSTYSFATFATKAGLKTRNYLKRVVDGERPLTADLIPKFCNGLGLKPKERTYFEALVHFNQAKDQDIKKHYFEVLKDSSASEPGRAIEILEHQYEIFSQWFILPVRELVALKEFHEDPQWIVRKMKNRISKKDAQHALNVLMKVGLLIRDEKTEKLKQASPIVRYSQDVVNMVVRDYHKQTLDQTKVSIDQDDFASWDMRSLNIAIPKSELKSIHEDLKEFIKKLNERLTAKTSAAGALPSDTVIQLNAQIVELTK